MKYFTYDERLGIHTPDLHQSWELYSSHEQAAILSQWENIRGTIPDRILAIEQTINTKQDQLSLEEDFERSCELNWEIASHASVINDLWLWYRTAEHVTNKAHT
ncbi:hypothetical protein A374_09478 [Fictibacillus macauensis ZFHKF-1]|uniref:Uncharacterized protein n=1 Tax=Fictibacillus macauensis ZFHKF-1 TaxID=1196324 RepID=I8AIC9_9BACL|nr:hypothetical protein [Fictibacillus macauensis]EIT85457.1 hypothetical protein A374_09478 [Fictibacillus macauensis ZFHKF-1]